MSTIRCANKQCGREIDLTPRMKQMQDEGKRTEFFCKACTKRMVDERVMNKIGLVKK